MKATVSKRTIAFMEQTCARRGLDYAAIVSGIDGLATGEAGSQVEWDAVALTLERLEAAIGGPEALEQEGYLSSDSSVVERLSAVVGAVASARMIYRAIVTWFGPHLVPWMLARYEDQPDGRVRIEMEIPETIRASPQFFHFTRGAYRGAPKMLGQADALVEADITPRHAVFLITPPPDLTLVSRFRRASRAMLGSKRALEELASQQDELRASYNALMKSQSELEREGEKLRALLQQAERDIAERERMEGERARLEAKLRQSQKMEALGTLAGGIAHDFNNLLCVITGNTSVVREDLPSNHPLQAQLEAVSLASLRATDLVRQVLAFGRPQSPKRDVVKLQPIVEDALKLLRASLPAMVEIRSHFAPNLPDVAADPTQVHQVVMNLGTNAAHAMAKRGGILAVRMEALAVSEDLPTSAGLREGPYLRLSMSDEGCGIEKEILARIFEPFFTTKPPGMGTGLGLSVVHGIMKSHEGTATVYSEPNKGTTFHLYFPSAGRAAAVEGPVSTAIPRGNGQHILHVDDEEALVELTKRILERLGYRVTSHTSPVEALQDFRSRPHEFHAVVTDHSMPGMSGVDLARRILELSPGVSVVMTSGYLRHEDTEAAMRAGVREVVLKPNTVQGLAVVLHEILKIEGD